MSRRKHGQKGVRYDPGATAEALIEAIAADLEEAQKRGDEEKARELIGSNPELRKLVDELSLDVK